MEIRAHNQETTIRGGGSYSLANHSRNGVLFDRRTKRNPVSQGYKGRESQRPISSASNITICYKYSVRSWSRGGQRSAGQGCLAGISSFASTVGQNQQDNGRRQHPSAGLQRCRTSCSRVSNNISGRERKRAGWGATISLEKLGRGMDRQTKALWRRSVH